MDLTPITTQPLKSTENQKPTELPTEFPNAGHIENGEKENLTETTAVFNPSDELNDNFTEEENEKRRQRVEEATDCCCVPYYSDDTDAFCLYLMCNWICDCFRGIGHCTEECFEGCANCLSECCEGDGGCLDCCTCDSAAADGDGFSGCLECCADCDCSGCDCSS